MGTIDKAAIGWSIGIVLVAVGIAAIGPASQQAAQPTTAPVMNDTMMDDTMADVMMDDRDTGYGSDTMMMDDAMMDDDTMMMDDTMMDDDTMMMDGAMAESGITQILIPEGTGVPGCEADDACFDPFSVEIRAGSTVVWTNNDNVVHMVNAGDLTEDASAIGFDYPNGFDSGLMMSGDTFEWTFDDAGDYPYLCQVHPWMVGTVTVS